MQKIKYFVYCRKSSEEDSKQIQSLETQERLMGDVRDRLGLVVVDIVHEQRSARKAGNRPQFELMLERIREGEAQGILVVHADRLSRNLIEAGKLIELLDEGKLKEVRTPSQVYSTATDMMYMGFDFLMASQFSRELSKKVRDGIETKLLKGEYPGYAPLGYVNNKEDHKIYPDPVRSMYIQMAFDLYSTGRYSLRQLSQILYDRGLRSKYGNRVRKNVLDRRLRDGVYCGVIVNKAKVYSGVHEPLVSQALFDRVQDVLSGKHLPRRQKHDFMFRGYLTCSKCGCALTTTKKKGKYIYYYCTNGRGGCDQHSKYLDEKDVFTLLGKEFEQFTLDPELAEISLELYKQSLVLNQDTLTQQRHAIRQEIERVEKKLSKLLDVYLADSISQEVYDFKQKELLNQKATLETQLKNLKPVNPEITLELLDQVKTRACNLKNLFDTEDEEVRRDVLKSILWNSEIIDKKIALIRYKKPYFFLQNLHKTHDIAQWQGWRDSNPHERFWRPPSYH